MALVIQRLGDFLKMWLKQCKQTVRLMVVICILRIFVPCICFVSSSNRPTGLERDSSHKATSNMEPPLYDLHKMYCLSISCTSGDFRLEGALEKRSQRSLKSAWACLLF